LGFRDAAHRDFASNALNDAFDHAASGVLHGPSEATLRLQEKNYAPDASASVLTALSQRKTRESVSTDSRRRHVP
jgi:hypothetical protein